VTEGLIIAQRVAIVLLAAYLSALAAYIMVAGTLKLYKGLRRKRAIGPVRVVQLVDYECERWTPAIPVREKDLPPTAWRHQKRWELVR
jgi:hypothetical protein